MKNSGTVLLKPLSSSVALVTLNRPAQGNGVVPEMARHLLEVLSQLEDDRAIRAAVITGAGDHFSAGADLFALNDYLRKDLATKQEPFNARILFPVTQKIASCRFPIIAAINGSATAGGLDLALACDLRVASTKAKFGETYVKVGLAPGNGGAYFLPRLIGSGRAAEMALTGDIITAQQALDIGLINYVVPPEELLSLAQSIAEKIASNPWRAVEATKQALRASWHSDLQGALNFGYWTASALHHTDDFKERVQSFVKRLRKGDTGKSSPPDGDSGSTG